ncbi:MAG: helix-turn-helix domain-containing protein [Ignavibacteria bacterium]|nr:helix-turn-helix domain-containing protein [Ignavibacteria bacterium]
MNQLNDSAKATILAQILKSPDFQDSKRYRELLQFLVDKSSAGASVKETEIAGEVFGKDSGFDPATDPLVRSYVSNLRKKLDHYYLTTEDYYNFKLEIPKGHYIVKYLPAITQKTPKGLGEQLVRYYLAVIITLVLVVIILAYREFRYRPSPVSPQLSVEASPLWNEFIQPNSRPTLVVLGDFFFMRERGDMEVYYRRGRINNLDEYLEYIRTNPGFGQRYMRNSFTFLRPSAPWGLMHILPILQHSTKGVSLKLASQFTSDDFKANNVIFVGSFKTLYVLKNFLHIFKLDYSTVPPSSFRIQDGIGDSPHVFRPERLSAGNLEKDYGVVAKGQGPDGSAIMMLLGFSESGVIQAAQAASDPRLLSRIAEQFPANTDINTASLTFVLAAEGMTQSLFDADIKYVAGIGPPMPTARPTPKDSVAPR